ncbi:hypothetical protein GCM10027273_27690 [Nocardioides pakistanensis]
MGDGAGDGPAADDPAGGEVADPDGGAEVAGPEAPSDPVQPEARSTVSRVATTARRITLLARVQTLASRKALSRCIISGQPWSKRWSSPGYS